MGQNLVQRLYQTARGSFLVDDALAGAVELPSQLEKNPPSAGSGSSICFSPSSSAEGGLGGAGGAGAGAVDTNAMMHIARDAIMTGRDASEIPGSY